MSRSLRGGFFVGFALFTVFACKTGSTPGAGVKAADEDAAAEVQAPVVSGDPGLYQGPPGGLPKAENTALWKQYCNGSDDVAATVVPNYSNELVAKAARILSLVNKESFAIYGDILKMHQTPMPAASGVAGLTPSAHNFLTYLCGEFRDRAPMIRAKVEWLFKMRYVADQGEGVAAAPQSCEKRNDPLAAEGANAPLGGFDPQGSPWAQLCIGDYEKYLVLSRSFFNAKQDALKATEGGQQIGTIQNVDRAVPAQTICETKFMMARYVKAGKVWDSLEGFNLAYEGFKAGCAADDLDTYYDFRGDSNFKPNSPEGNGMIWFARSVAAQCESRVKAKPGMTMTDADCRRYFEEPFKSRYSAARSGLAAWMLHTFVHETDMADTQAMPFSIVQHYVGDNKYVFGDKGPYLFRIKDIISQNKMVQAGKQGKLYDDWQSRWTAPDMGLSALSGQAGEGLAELLYRRVRNAVDRHTDWYTSGFDSDPNLPSSAKARLVRSQAYSPFVASSYEMSESDGFTGCGVTIDCGDRGPDFTNHKHWMFIFKVKKKNWVKPEDLAAGLAQLDFDRMWFDETSFGDSYLANKERAWDRLGSPMEDEHAEILYLWRMTK